MSDSVRPYRWQPTRLPRPWDAQGKNTGVGCHFLLQCMKVKSESEVAQSCLTLSDPTDCSLPGSSVHGFSRQEYWSGVPLPSPRYVYAATAKSLQSCPTLRPHRQQPTRLLCPWDSPGKSTGVGCHFLLQDMCIFIANSQCCTAETNPTL